MKLFKIMDTAFQNFDNTVNTYIKRVFNSLGLSNSNSQIFTLLFNGIKGVMQNAMFYIEDALTEQNIYTATRKKSIYNLAKISGYEPFYGAAATGTLLCKIKRGNYLDNDLTKIFIPNKTRVVNKKTNIKYNLIFSSNEFVIDLSKPLISHEFKIVEGIFNTNKYYASGYKFETFNIETIQLFDKSYLNVYVNNKKYELCDCIYDMSEDAEQCTVTVGYDNTFSIIFGDGIYGKLLNEGDNVVVEWLSHRGKNANILSSETTDFIFYDAGKDMFGNTVNLNSFINISMINCVSGGINEDSITLIKNMIGYNSRSLVLASQDNFKLFFKRFSFIGKVNCWIGDNSLVIFTACVTNAINKEMTADAYFSTNKDSLLLSKDQEDQIIQTLNNSNKLFAGSVVKFIQPLIRRYAVICFIKEDSIYNRETIKDMIRNSFVNYFINLPDNTLIIYKSDLIKNALNDCQYIKFLDIEFISELAEETYKNTYYEKYELKNINNNFNYVSTKIFYESENKPGLDSYGNISLNNIMEIPLLQGGFHYYPNKEINDRNTSINIETIQYYFI